MSCDGWGNFNLGEWLVLSPQVATFALAPMLGTRMEAKTRILSSSMWIKAETRNISAKEKSKVLMEGSAMNSSETHSASSFPFLPSTLERIQFARVVQHLKET